MPERSLESVSIVVSGEGAYLGWSPQSTSQPGHCVHVDEYVCELLSVSVYGHDCV